MKIPVSMAARADSSLPANDNLISLGRIRFRRSDIGIFPLLAVLPFMYYPRILGGDTQPWILMAAVVAFFTFRPQRFFRIDDGLLVVLAALCVFVYAARGGEGFYLLRAAYGQLTFIVLWLVCGRENGDFFPNAIRLTIVVWLAVGLYQFLSITLGLPVDISGRFVAGRGGIPSLASEPSMYGSLSMLHMMYLLSERKRKNNMYIAAAAISVVLSGSLLALLLLAFPLMKMKMHLRMATLAGIPLLIAGDYLFASSGLTLRLASLGGNDAGLMGVLLDPSINLRVGHLYFTLVVNLFDSLTMVRPIEFMEQYNSFAAHSKPFIETGSEFILPAIGELIYSYGIFGAALILVFFSRVFAATRTTASRIEKAAFILACMLNPITLSNAFLIIYAQQKRGSLQ